MQSSSWVLARLNAETRHRHPIADADRLALLTSPATESSYRAFLSRIFGFESPLEAAFRTTGGLDEIIDLRSRTTIKLLRSDLLALGVTEPAELRHCRSGFHFRTAIDALGWIYVVERNTLLNGVIRRHVAKHAPEQAARASAYLTSNERAIGARIRELGVALDHIARSPEIADRIVESAHAAFRCQQHWFAEVVPVSRVAAIVSPL